MTAHKPVVVITDAVLYCRLCGVPVDQRTARNGRTVTTHDPVSNDRYPILGDDLRPVEPAVDFTVYPAAEARKGMVARPGPGAVDIFFPRPDFHAVTGVSLSGGWAHIDFDDGSAWSGRIDSDLEVRS
jgi:hypothetical protein